MGSDHGATERKAFAKALFFSERVSEAKVIFPSVSKNTASFNRAVLSTFIYNYR